MACRRHKKGAFDIKAQIPSKKRDAEGPFHHESSFYRLLAVVFWFWSQLCGSVGGENHFMCLSLWMNQQGWINMTHANMQGLKKKVFPWICTEKFHESHESYMSQWNFRCQRFTPVESCSRHWLITSWQTESVEDILPPPPLENLKVNTNHPIDPFKWRRYRDE